jgi:glycosyltransferase involved in cell wall biosynthesis
VKILIYNPSARVGGAISILKDVYKEINGKADYTNEYIFVVGDVNLAETENITVCKYPWVKKNWLLRVYFDLFLAPKIVKKYKVDRVITYQNMTIPFIEVPQTLYLQQPLPFIDKRFKLSESKKLWLYQNVICKFVVRSLKKASKIIVQTQWMKKACTDKFNVSTDIIEVQPPIINLENKYKYTQTASSQKTFFFPASGLLYKNHQTILEACKKLNAENIKDYKVVFTLDGKEDSYTSYMKKTCENNLLNIDFIGHLDREKVYEMYSKSILIFPSYVETFGLPLLEAKLVGAPIIASDSPFSHEILDNYSEVSYFKPFDSEELARLMKIYIRKI